MRKEPLPSVGVSVDPKDHPFGYVLDGAPRASTREKLLAIYARDVLPPRITSVWTPESAGFVAPYDVDFLVAAYEAVVRRDFRRKAVVAALGAAALVAIAVALTGELGLGRLAVLFAVYALLALVPFLLAFGERLDAHRAARARLAAPDLDRTLSRLLARTQAAGSYTLAGAWWGIVVVSLFAGGDRVIRAAGLVKEGAERGEAWRMLTAAFVHAGVYHAMFNASALLAWGPLVEATVGSPTLGLVFLLSALGGSAASLALVSQTSVGASGGLLGVLGFLLVYAWRERRRLPIGFLRRLATSLAFVALYGVLLAFLIDNAAHGGGLATGVVCGLFLARGDPSAPPVPSAARAAAGVVAWCVLACAFALTVVLAWPN